MSNVPFDRVVAEHGAAVHRVCRAVAGADDADDAWSETFLAALRAYPDLRPDSNVHGWLVTIAYRKAVDRRRTAARQPVPAAELPDRPADPFMATLADDELWDAVRRLPDKQRAAVAYRYLAGLPYREIGEALGTSAAAARRSAADGVANLRRHLDTLETS